MILHKGFQHILSSTQLHFMHGTAQGMYPGGHFCDI